MAVYRNVHISFWTDPKVDDTFTPEDKYFYLYLLTNPHTNICGCYEIGTRQLMRETGYSEDTVQRLLGRMQAVHNVVRFDPNTKEVLILHWHRYNWTKSAKLVKAVNETSSHVKSERFRTYIQQLLESGKAEYPEGINTLSIPSANPMPTSVAVADTVTVSVSEAGRPQSRDALLTFCADHSIQESFGTEFYDRYAANDWTSDRGEPIRNWRNLLLAAWRKAKTEQPPSPTGTSKISHEDTITSLDCEEWPPGSGMYLPRKQVEELRRQADG